MRHTSILLCYLFAYLLPVLAFSQNREYISNKMFWTETTFAGKIKNKFSYQIDYQYRRSADAENVEGGNHTNIFKNSYQQMLRPWLHYQVNDALRVSISPFGFWGTWSEFSDNRFFVPENRISLQAILNQKMGRLTITHRYRYEFRFIGDRRNVENSWNLYESQEFFSMANTRNRLRYYLRALVPINNATLKHNTVYVNVYNELFINMGKAVRNTNLIDQNRFFAGLGYRFKSDIRLEVGYLNQLAFRFNNALQNNIEQNDALQIFLIFDDFNRFFRTKKDPEVK